MKTLYKHQQELIDLNPSKWLLAWEMRTGKSAAALMLSIKKVEKILIVYPKSVDWEQVIIELGHSDCYQLLNNKSIKKIEDKNIYLCTKEFFRDHKEHLPICKTIIIDEGHHFSGWSSKMYKNAMEYIKNCVNIYILTGTPYRVSPFNVFCLANLLGHNLNWWKWQAKFYDKIKMGYMIKGGKKVPRIVPVLKKKINGIPTEKYLAGLINKLGNTVKLSDVAGETYIEDILEKFDITSDQVNAIKGLNDTDELSRRTRIFQILNGTLKSDGYSENKYFKSEKFNRAIDIINETKKIIVVCKHTLEIKRFVETIKDRKVFVLNGKTDINDRQEIMKEFNNINDAVILVQSQVCEGFSLFSPVMMFYSMHNGFVEYSQMKSRPLMPDRKNSIIYIYMIVDSKEYPYDKDCYTSVVINKQSYNYEIYNYEKNRSPIHD